MAKAEPWFKQPGVKIRNVADMTEVKELEFQQLLMGLNADDGTLLEDLLKGLVWARNYMVIDDKPSVLRQQQMQTARLHSRIARNIHSLLATCDKNGWIAPVKL